MPTVSIGLPVYNGERYLGETIQSVLDQTFTDFELIISDNGSTDSTKDIALACADRDPRIRFYRSETNGGLAWNYRRVFELARGPYFRWAPADDKFAPTSLERCVEVLESHPEAVLCYPKTLLIDPDSKVIGPYEDELELRSASPVERFRVAIQRNRLINAIYGLMRSDVLRRTPVMGGFPGSDVTLLAELSLYGQFWEIPERLFLRRMHEQSSTSLTTMEQIQAFVNPKAAGKLFLYHWRHAYENLRAIRRFRCGAGLKTRLLGCLAMNMLHSRDGLFSDLRAIPARLFRRRAQPIDQAGWKDETSASSR